MMKSFTPWALVLLCLVTTPALAGFGSPDWPCAQDAAKHCPELKTQDEVLACLKKSRLKLTDLCKTEIDRLATTDKPEPDCDTPEKKKEAAKQENPPDENCEPELVFEEIKGTE